MLMGHFNRRLGGVRSLSRHRRVNTRWFLKLDVFFYMFSQARRVFTALCSYFLLKSCIKFIRIVPKVNKHDKIEKFLFSNPGKLRCSTHSKYFSSCQEPCSLDCVDELVTVDDVSGISGS